MEVFEEHVVLPSLLELGDFIGFSKTDFILRDAFRGLHPLEMVWFHEQCKSASRYIFACDLFAPDDAMGSGLQVATCVDLGGLSELEGQHMRWDGYFCPFRKSILGVKAST